MLSNILKLVKGNPLPPDPPDNAPEFTPVQFVDGIHLKRDDLYCFAGIRGGKVRSCLAIVSRFQEKTHPIPWGLVTASVRKSPQMQIVARVAHRLGIPARCHTATGAETDEMLDAVAHGAEIITHRPGYNSVICHHAGIDAERLGWCHIPFGMEHYQAVTANAIQARFLADEINAGRQPRPKRIIVPLGSGMSACGILCGLRDSGLADLRVLGVRVGGDPTRRLNQYVAGWGAQMDVVTAPEPYERAVEASIGDIVVDPHYEAKCVRYLEPGDLFWIIGIRAM